MTLSVVGAGLGRTGTNSLKIALEQLLGQPCHHMYEVIANPTQIPGWTDAIEGRSLDWPSMPTGYGALVDWPGAPFWPELSAANPDAVRKSIPHERLLEWSPSDGWEPMCERLNASVPDNHFPKTNDLNQWRADFGMPALT